MPNMSSNLRIDTSIDELRLQQLLAQQADIQAQIASLLPASAPTSSHQHRSPIQKHNRRSSNVPRSMPNHGPPPMTRKISHSDRNEAPSRNRTQSQRSAPMARTNSRGATSQPGQRTGNFPFAYNGSMPPPLHSESRREKARMTAAWTLQEQPANSYPTNHQSHSLQRSISQRKPELQRVPENGHALGDLVDPSEYLANLGTPLLSVQPALPTPTDPRLPSHRIPTPSTPLTDTLSNATTLTSNAMSRQSSVCNDQMIQSIEMMNCNSNTSYSDISHVDQAFYDQITPNFPFSPHSRRSSNEEQSQILLGAGGASHNSLFLHSLSSHSSCSGSFGEKMEKSQSNESNSSSSSFSRNKLRLQTQNQMAAARPLMPKGESDGLMSRDCSSQSMTRLDSKEGSDKIAITKPAYQRPKHDRVHCKKCNCHPEGFRGEHELRRHMDREHKRLVKKWVCFEPTDGLNHPKPIIPLSRCKACGQQKKKYGAYYNAAAHLRRTHFNPKISKGRKHSKGDNEEKRGGTGGGEWPAMSELKYWMKEVQEPATEYTLSESQQEEADASEEDINITDELIYSQQSVSTASSNGFDDAIFADNTANFTMYPAAVNDIFNASMPLESQSQCMDQSIFTTASSQDFSNFSPTVYQNDAMTFYDASSISQPFEDQQVVLDGPGFNFTY